MTPPTFCALRKALPYTFQFRISGQLCRFLEGVMFICDLLRQTQRYATTIRMPEPMILKWHEDTFAGHQ